MKRKNTKRPYCVVCRTHSDGAGLTLDTGVHICFDCAEMLHDVMEHWHNDHLDHCECEHCRPKMN